MRRGRAWTWNLAAAMAGAFVVLGCPGRKSAPSTAEVEAAAADPTASVEAEADAPVAAAANEADITRYPDETPIDHALGTTHVFASSVRTQASATTGAVIASLKSETDVDEIAEHQGFVLVYFIDTKDASRKLMGWVSKADFTAPSPIAPGAIAPATGCNPPLLLVQHAGGQSCERTCADDRGCPSGLGACTAEGELVVGGKVTSPVRFCRPADPIPTPSPPPSAPRPLDVRRQHGICPGGYVRCGAMCRLRCSGPDECGAGAHCLAGYCLRPGAAPCPRPRRYREDWRAE